MKKQIYIFGVFFALTGGAQVSPLSHFVPSAVAAVAEVESHQDQAEELFSDDEHAEEHDEHGQAAPEVDEHGHAVAERDEHGADEELDEHGHAASEDGICSEHLIPEAEDALCNPDLIGKLQPGMGLKVRLASADVAAKAGVRLSTPQSMTLAEGIDIPGRVEFNRHRLAAITPMEPGVIRKVSVRLGDRVTRGQVLAEVAMPEMASLKTQLLAARAKEVQTEAMYNREKDLLERGISSRQEFQQAESQYSSARSASRQYHQQLLNFGLSQADIEQLLLTSDISALVPLRAPFAGTIVEVSTALGEAVAPGTALFNLADLDNLWVELSLPESRIYQAQIDAPVQVRFDGLPAMAFSGRIFQVGAAIEERTRTLKVLAEVKNPGHRLKVGMFGKARLLEGDETRVLTIPPDALQSIDGRPFVFIQQESDLFELRHVRTGAKTRGIVPIIAGLMPGEQVVSSQGFALKSEILKARLGASCADH